MYGNHNLIFRKCRREQDSPLLLYTPEFSELPTAFYAKLGANCLNS